jgi:hypothetical protein
LGEKKNFIQWAKIQKRELCPQISFSTPGALRGHRFGIGIVRERGLIKGRKIMSFLGIRRELPGAQWSPLLLLSWSGVSVHSSW